METARIVVDEALAKERLQQYRAAKAPKTTQDLAIMRAYRQVARGKVIIRAHESIRQAGFNAEGAPKLAICRATVKHIRCYVRPDSVRFEPTDGRSSRGDIEVDAPTIEGDGRETYTRFDAIVPLIPLHLRPKGSLRPYHILWEADWRTIPIDPMLLRRLSGDLWLVVAAWDLTDIERAVLG